MVDPAPKPVQTFDRSIVEGPIGPAVWRLAWPTMLQNAIAGLQGIIDHAMVKWDATGRDHAGEPPRPSDLIVKDERYLKKVLKESEDAEVLVIATWNDLGEGTGFNRNYDYYFRGQWQRTDYFMRVTRKAQAGALK